MKNALILLSILFFLGCKDDTVRLQKSIEGSWRLNQIAFSTIQGTSQDSIATYSEGGFIFKAGKADNRNEVSYRLGANQPIFATYVTETETVFFNEPCCNVDRGQTYFMPNGNFQFDFSSEGRVVLSGPAYLVNQPGKPLGEVQIFLRRSDL